MASGERRLAAVDTLTRSGEKRWNSQIAGSSGSRASTAAARRSAISSPLHSAAFRWNGASLASKLPAPSDTSAVSTACRISIIQAPTPEKSNTVTSDTTLVAIAVAATATPSWAQYTKKYSTSPALPIKKETLSNSTTQLTVKNSMGPSSRR